MFCDENEFFDLKESLQTMKKWKKDMEHMGRKLWKDMKDMEEKKVE